MRITREVLLKNARDLVERRTRQNRNIQAAYLCGSLLNEEKYLLGGTGDIDLVLIYVDATPAAREAVSLTPEVHLDIAHHAQKEYLQPRLLRVHPWLGPTIKSCQILFDPQHFLDFTQASVRGQFDRPDHVVERSRRHVELARQIWQSLGMNDLIQSPQDLEAYLRAVGHAANAVAVLNGAPLTERRFLLDFPGRAAAVGRAGMSRGLMGLLGGAALPGDALSAWLPDWESAYRAIPVEGAPVRLHPKRQAYYQHAFPELSQQQPEAILWPLLHTWTLAALHLDEVAPGYQGWQQVCQGLGLYGVASGEKLAALDAFLDLVEETLEDWAVKNGA